MRRMRVIKMLNLIAVDNWPPRHSFMWSTCSVFVVNLVDLRANRMNACRWNQMNAETIHSMFLYVYLLQKKRTFFSFLRWNVCQPLMRSSLICLWVLSFALKSAVIHFFRLRLFFYSFDFSPMDWVHIFYFAICLILLSFNYIYSFHFLVRFNLRFRRFFCVERKKMKFGKFFAYFSFHFKMKTKKKKNQGIFNAIHINNNARENTDDGINLDLINCDQFLWVVNNIEKDHPMRNWAQAKLWRKKVRVEMEMWWMELH